MDVGLGVQGFGIELRSESSLAGVFAAGDVVATDSLLRKVDLAAFGTRHRAMMRYCFENAGTLGLAVSRDGDIQAMTRIGARLVLWENIDVQLAQFPEARLSLGPQFASVLRPVVTRPE